VGTEDALKGWTTRKEIGSLRGGEAAAKTAGMTTISPHSTCSAILVAAGASRRMGFDKLAAELAGMPVLRRTLEAFLAAESIAEVVVVCPQDRWQLLGGNFPKPVKRVDGGESRQDSVVAGLTALSLDSRFVAVHDGARPLVSPTDIDRCVAAAEKNRAAALARRATETLKRSDALDFSTEGVSREQLWFMETPQVFEIPMLVAAYAEVAARGHTVTDEVSAMEAVGVRVKFVESTRPNLKITTPADLALAEALLR
jgi:2-C-methyl-D-erythritol 4-phosphate cytidylyltransferase